MPTNRDNLRLNLIMWNNPL